MEEQRYQTLTLSRTINVPAQAVWDAWTKSEEFAKWWAPDQFSIPLCEIDARVGGQMKVNMQGPDGAVYPSTGEYREVDAPTKLSFVNSPLDQAGNKVFEVEQTIELSETEGKTGLTLTAKVVSATPEAKPYLDGMEQGINQALDKLTKYLEA